MTASKAQTYAPRAVRVSVASGTGSSQWEFRGPFRIGRTDECEVCVKDEHVSRVHAEVAFENGNWWIRDLGSANGLYSLGHRFESASITDTLILRLGILGPEVTLTAEQPPQKEEIASPDAARIAQYVEHYFGDTDAPAGEHTMFIRQAFARVQTKQKRKYGYVVAVLLVCLAIAGTYAAYEHVQVKRQRMLAENLFYAMKALEVDTANHEIALATSSNPQAVEVIRANEKRRAEIQENYDRFLATLHIYDPKMTEQQRLILRVARIFGECELDMPPDFMAEVNRYIKMWQSSGRFARGIKKAQLNGYIPVIKQEFLNQDLPVQYFYLALQESDFDPFNSGPPTSKGIAKGMWQFIPETAIKYGLHLGPLVDLRRPDPADERHHWQIETKVAARYIKDLYSTDAQASGLLVISCYNWGEGRVLPLVRSMPENPRERNFWQLLAKHRDQIPPETYDYVFYIVSAAVIGENPRLFGFDFDNPLADVNTKASPGPRRELAVDQKRIPKNRVRILEAKEPQHWTLRTSSSAPQLFGRQESR